MDKTQGKIVRCPTCGGDSMYAESNLMRPFCSIRCKNMDLGAWASEQFTVPTEAPNEDISLGVYNSSAPLSE